MIILVYVKDKVFIFLIYWQEKADKMQNCFEFKFFCERRTIKRYNLNIAWWLRLLLYWFGLYHFFSQFWGSKIDSQMYMIILNNKTLALRKTLSWWKIWFILSIYEHRIPQCFFLNVCSCNLLSLKNSNGINWSADQNTLRLKIKITS